jgi:hypothetical protein
LNQDIGYPRATIPMRILIRLLLLGACGAAAISACGDTQLIPRAIHDSTPAPTHASQSAAPTVASNLAVAPGFCDSVDTPIPGATVGGGPGEPAPFSVSAVDRAWISVDATIVPACSEVRNDPQPPQVRNLTNGALTDSELSRWVDLDLNNQTLWDWATRHGQWGLERFLLPAGNSAITFVEDGGTIAARGKACEYPSKIYALPIDAAEVAHLTAGQLDVPAVAYAQAWSGPCSITWTAPNGQVTNYPIAAGQEERELDITETRSTPALGSYLLFLSSIDPSSDPVAENILAGSGI